MPRKVLIITPQTPFPPDQGAPIRNFNFIRYLGSTGKYAITLLSFARFDESEAEQNRALVELSKYCKKVGIVPAPPARSKIKRLLNLAFNSTPDLAQRLASERFTRRFTELVNEIEPDVVLCEALEMTPFVLAALKTPLKTRPRLVLDEHNAEHMLQRRAFESDLRSGWKRKPVAIYSKLQSIRLEKYEKQVLNRFDASIAVSKGDREVLQKLTGRPITIVPNGIDINEFSPDDSCQEVPDRLVFTGSMDFRPNVDAVTWFGSKVWPLVLQRKPRATFYIVGRRPDPAVQALANLTGITVTGKVPDTRPYIAGSALYVVPMRMGGGSRFKVLEALAMGKAVLSTTMGVDGIPLLPGKDAVVADSAEEFAGTLVRLLDDPAQRRVLAANGRAYVQEHFDWRKITPLLDQVL